jgi:hypothetical protein
VHDHVEHFAWRDFTEQSVRLHAMTLEEAEFFLELSNLGPFPVSPELGQFIIGSQLTRYSWSTLLWSVSSFSVLLLFVSTVPSSNLRSRSYLNFQLSSQSGSNSIFSAKSPTELSATFPCTGRFTTLTLPSANRPWV